MKIEIKVEVKGIEDWGIDFSRQGNVDIALSAMRNDVEEWIANGVYTSIANVNVVGIELINDRPETTPE